MLVTPTLDQVLEFCARDPVERVFLEDVARRGFARYRALEEGDRLSALCYFGANVVPSGEGCGAFAGPTAQPSTRMIIGDEQAVTELWGPAEARMSAPREDRPGQPVYVLDQPPDGEDTGLRQARVDDLDLLLPACAATHREELGVDPLERDPGGFRRRTLGQIHERRSWLWAEDGTILLQGRGVGVDAERGAAPAGLGRPRRAQPGACPARAAPPLPDPPREHPDGLPVRPAGERAGDSRV